MYFFITYLCAIMYMCIYNFNYFIRYRQNDPAFVSREHVHHSSSLNTISMESEKLSWDFGGCNSATDI